ncbi:hypothetical protein Tco_0890962 [Tanacetum coccineum]|uniref:Xylulose kinase-1 n=1 Tax=Tanacetum coccineum TaxID=301880 RepID=A0ABQ5C1J4_9ASTR
MAYLQFGDKHNMVAFLKKPKNSEGFHEIVDFLNQSTLRYALITNPTIYTSQIKQFWQTATVKTLDSGEVEIKATVDGHDKTITEASVRSSLQLADADGISNMSTTEIFKQIALMGQAAEIPQSQFPTQTQVVDEATFTSVYVDAGGGATTNIRLDAGQGSGIIHKTPTKLNDVPLLGVNTPGSVEGSLSQTELMDLRVKSLEDQLKIEKFKYTRRKFQIVISEDEADLPAEDSSKQGRMIEDIDLDVDTSLVQPHAAKYFHFVTLTKISASGEAHSLDISLKDQLGDLSAAKILADAVKSDTVPKTFLEVQTYTRRRRDVIDVNTGSEAVNIASDFFNAAKASVNNVGDSIPVKDKDLGQREEVAQKLYAEELEKDTTRQEQEKNDIDKALELQKQLDERVKVVAKVNQAHDIDWSDPVVLRYHAL